MGKHFDRAQVLFNQRKYDLAASEFKQEIAENPDSDRGYTALALSLMNQGKIESETLNLIDYALSLDAENDWNHYTLAFYWYLNSNYERAQVAIEQAIAIDPDSDLYFYILARILFDRGQTKFTLDTRRSLGAILLLSRGALLPIGFGLLSLCKGYLLRSYLKATFAPLEKSLAINPEYLPALNLQTELLMITRRPKRALASSQTGLEIDPNNEIAHRLHGEILTRCGRYTQAIDHFQSSLRINPSSQETQLGLLEAMRSQYWIYPWISMTGWRGNLTMFSILAIGIIARLSIDNSAPELANIRIFLGIFIATAIVNVIFLSFPARWIFNLCLQFDPKNRLLLSERTAIISNYIAGIALTILTLSYISNLSFLVTSIYPTVSDYQSLRSGIAAIVGIIAGILTSVATFHPVHRRTQLPTLSTGYQLIVGILGIVSIVVYLQSNEIGIPGQLFGFLVLFSPIIAIMGIQE
jgi:tetratricopeptide (TPR) repeat protein